MPATVGRQGKAESGTGTTLRSCDMLVTVTGDYRQCTDLTASREPESSTPQSRPGAQSRVPRPRPFPFPGEILKEAHVLQHWSTHIGSITFEKLVHQWMQLSVRGRATLSHNGAVRSRPGDPMDLEHCNVETRGNERTTRSNNDHRQLQ